MAAPSFDVCQWNYRNPQATGVLRMPVIVLCNTPEDEIWANVEHNSALDLEWVKAEPEHDGIAVMVGGGPSVADHLDDIRALCGTVFALNGASKYLRANGIAVDWQVTCDAKAETATLIDPGARGYLLASQVNPATVAAARAPKLWHMAVPGIEDHFPPQRRKRGGYALFGGEASTGLGALCVAYALGFRRFEIFGYDSSHRFDDGHAYAQKMNDVIPVLPVTWAGRAFMASVTMRTQAERFPIVAQALQQSGATINVHGDGLLQHIWRTPPELLSEREKYVKMWQRDGYRAYSPAEVSIEDIARFAPSPPATIIDFGCGTGRAGVKLAERGYDVVLVDFASNARDAEACALPFFEFDLSQPCPLRAPYGYCCDVLEHIPPTQVDAVITNIMASAPQVFFQISTVPDRWGVAIGQSLHLSVHPASWWVETFKRLGYSVQNVTHTGNAAQLVATRLE